MSEPEPDREKPQPPLPGKENAIPEETALPSAPPAPPPRQLLGQVAPHVPLTPMMDFFQRRMEAMERDLAQERAKAQSAQNMLSHQDALRSEVESSLKTLHEQLRREKSERESEEEKFHARGRIEALEKRLDEMHQTWAAMLKESVARGSSQDQAENLHKLKSDIEQELSQGNQRLMGPLGERLAAFAAQITDTLGAWERRQSLEVERREARLEEINRERAALQRQWEEANHAVRQEFVQERIARESVLAEQVADLARRLDSAAAGEIKSAAAAAEVKAEVAKVFTLLNTPPQAKDQIIADLEREKSDLLKALKDRNESLAQHLAQRREVENTLGAGILEINSRLEAERERGRQMQGRIAELAVELKAAQDLASGSTKTAQDRERYASALAAERDGLARALVSETEKAKDQIEARNKFEAEGTQRLESARQRLESELARGAELAAAVSELRAQIATLTEHMTKALQEKDAVSNRFAAWNQEREKLLQTIRDKDEMISMLSSTFQGLMKKQ